MKFPRGKKSVWEPCSVGTYIDFHPPLTIPVASINLDPHADSAPVVAVGQEANLAGPNWRVQFVFGLEVRVLVAGDHLQQRKIQIELI
jgi:hypothetical protein